MSKLKNISEKNMRFILKRVNNDIGNYGHSKELVSNTNHKVVKNILDDIGMTANNEDLSFIFALYRMNPNYETEPIKIPELHTYEIITKRYATINVREYWKNTIESYLEDENDVGDFVGWFNNSDWWDGDMIDRDEYDEETTDTDIDEINKIS